jgi:hypothetical protein
MAICGSGDVIEVSMKVGEMPVDMNRRKTAYINP